MIKYVEYIYICVCAFSYSMADVSPCLFEMVRDGEKRDVMFVFAWFLNSFDRSKWTATVHVVLVV